MAPNLSKRQKQRLIQLQEKLAAKAYGVGAAGNKGPGGGGGLTGGGVTRARGNSIVANELLWTSTQKKAITNAATMPIPAATTNATSSSSQGNVQFDLAPRLKRNPTTQSQISDFSAPRTVMTNVAEELEKLREELDDLVASECVLCGELMIRSIDQAFIQALEERDEIDSWLL